MGIVGTFEAGAVIVALLVGVIFIFCLIATITGIFVAWVVSLTPLGAFVENGFIALGLPAEGQLINIGAAIGFTAGFFKGIVEVKGKD